MEKQEILNKCIAAFKEKFSEISVEELQAFGMGVNACYSEMEIPAFVNLMHPELYDCYIDVEAYIKANEAEISKNPEIISFQLLEHLKKKWINKKEKRPKLNDREVTFILGFNDVDKTYTISRKPQNKNSGVGEVETIFANAVKLIEYVSGLASAAAKANINKHDNFKINFEWKEK